MISAKYLLFFLKGKSSFYNLRNTKLVLLYCLVFVTLLIGFSPKESFGQTRLDDSLALVDLYTTTNGANWTTTWDFNQQMDGWFGVIVSSGRVTELDLDGIPNSPQSGTGNNLSGSIPDLNLTVLSLLDLSNNSLTGTIPDFSNLNNLTQLDLWDNQLTNAIPDFSSLPNLAKLELTRNQLNGTIPDFTNLGQLQYLDLTENQLSGSFPDFSNLPQMSYLRIGSNLLTGTIPDFTNLPVLSSLILDYNQFSGSIPNFSNLPILNELFLRGNQLSGTIPDLTNLPFLTNLALRDNQLTGSIPDFSNLPNLTLLNLRENQLSGAIPNFSNLTSLEDLSLSSNQLTGSVPNFTNLSTLKSIGLNDNQLTGLIPDFTNLPNLEFLFLYQNQLTGTVPDYSNLQNLNILHLAENSLSFSDLIPNYASNSSLTIANGGYYSYLNQDTIGTEQLLKPYINGTVVMDLLVDNLVTTSSYDWYKNGQFFRNTLINELILPNFRVTDQGIYHCEINNSVVPNLTLTSRPIQVNLNPLQNRFDDSLALVDLYNATNGPGWTITWDLTKPMDSMYGVQLLNNRVHCLDLDGSVDCLNTIGTGTGNNLTGNLVDLNLTNLVELYLSRNAITGGIIDFTNLPILEKLHLEDNQLTGPVPDLLNLSNLKELNLTQNQLVGSIPDFSNMPNLEMLYIGANQLTGLIPDFSNLPKLQIFSSSINQLTGFLPDFSNLPDLTTIYLSGNQLKGTIPDFSGIGNLETAYISGNQLTGGLPNFTNLPNLKELFLSNNRLDGNIPKFSNVPLLNTLYIQQNRLTFSELVDSYVFLDSQVNFYQFGSQDSIPLFKIGNQYFVEAGGNESDNTYYWHKDGTPTDTIQGTKFYTPLSSGLFHCEIVNALIPGKLNSQASNLTSDSIVYPGDANANGKVEITDVLYCGNAYNNNGPSRPNASVNWTPQTANNWTTTVRGVNNKHQDCNGDGMVGDLDLSVIELNFDSITPAYLESTTATLSSDYYIDIKPITDTTVMKGNTAYRQRRYDVCLQNALGGIVAAKGVSFSLNYAYASPDLNIFTEIDNSALGNTTDLRKVERFKQGERRLDAGMFTILQDTPINGPVARIIIEELLSGANLLGDSIDIQVAAINVLMIDTLLPVNGQAIYMVNGSDSTNFGNTVSATVTANYPNCMHLGRANAYSNDAGSHFYQWSTGETTPSISGLAPGEYSVTVSSTFPTDIPAIIPFTIPQPQGCSDVITLSTKLFLEGALDETYATMSPRLRTKGLLPLQAPFELKDSTQSTVLLTSGDQGIVDWIKLELRSGEDPSKIVNQCAALICSNGAIVSTDGFSPLKLATITDDSLYVVFKHRNHLPIMVGPVYTNELVTWDLTQNNLTSDSNAMKEVSSGIWALFVGDASNDNSIDGFDKLLWNNQNGNFNQYLKVDFNFDGDISGADKIIWSINNGKFSNIP